MDKNNKSADMGREVKITVIFHDYQGQMQTRTIKCEAGQVKRRAQEVFESGLSGAMLKIRDSAFPREVVKIRGEEGRRLLEELYPEKQEPSAEKQNQVKFR